MQRINSFVPAHRLLLYWQLLFPGAFLLKENIWDGQRGHTFQDPTRPTPFRHDIY